MIYTTPEMRRVILYIQKSKIDPDFVSPNYVASIAAKLKVDLKPYQIVYISDNFI